MLWLRSFAYFAFLFVTVMPWAFVVLSGWLFPVHTRYSLCRRWTAMAIWGARVICGIKYKVEGWHNLPDGPAIVLPKHQSTWETFWLPIGDASRPDIRLQTRTQLGAVFRLGHRFGADDQHRSQQRPGCVRASRGARQGSAWRAGGGSSSFPKERARSRVASKRYKTGGARLAVRTGAWAVPIAVDSGEYWPKGRFIKTTRHVISVSIGPAIDPQR